MANFGLLAAALLLSSCSAQESNDTSLQDCQGPINAIASGSQYFNSTGTVRLASDQTHDDDWYVSVTITDRRDPNHIYGPEMPWQEREAFISVPNSLVGSQDGNQTEYCVYELPGQDASSQQEAGDCSGVLSDDCIDALMQNTPVMSDGQCHKPENVEDACGMVASQPVEGAPSNFNSTECSLSEMPHVELPDNYRTYYAHYVPVSEGGGGYENFDLYDTHVRQAVPMVFTIKSPGGTIAHKAVCVAPNNVADGSRVPESGAAQLSPGTSLVVALTVMAFVSVEQVTIASGDL
ncbi:hypothetical protein J4E83_007119 [Alternaria metachromatica]|uniref:uncharacterized protein n=1 Tax=Alternaria metachromatica TaxID=283354 RepID=UPI0020C4EF3E|nr:uncharacterized protein J4E83_007119 [Alternaria metachromatica]KAI4614465.1 hypothetical protein J4E83_007119 [Alternaria metachromatica]